MPVQRLGCILSPDRTKALLKMNALLIFFLAYTFLRSLSNGVDRLYNINLSMTLSITTIAIGLVAAWHVRHVTIHKRLFTLLICLSIFLVTCGI
jgi:hypothetical protein